MAGSESAQSCRSVYPVFGSMYCRFHTALWDHWGELWFISIESLSCRILLTCRRVLGGLQIDEYNIAGRHHRCVVAIPLACGNLPEAHHHFVRWLCLALGRQLSPWGWPALVCIRLHPVQASHVRPVTLLGRPFWAKPVLRRFSGPRIGSVRASSFVDDFVSCWGKRGAYRLLLEPTLS